MQSVFSSQIVLCNLGSNAIDNCNVFYDQLVKCSHLANRIDIVVKISDDDINQQVFFNSEEAFRPNTNALCYSISNLSFKKN